MSKKISKEQVDEVFALFDNGKWQEAERLLLSYKNTSDAMVHYLLGCLYFDWNNPNKNHEKAVRHFVRVIDSDEPLPYAFEALSDIEKNKAHSIRIIEKGLKVFPNSESLYYKLLIRLEANKREGIYQEASKVGINSDRIKIRMAETHFELGNYEYSLGFLENVKGVSREDDSVLNCLRGFSYYELGKAEQSKSVFSNVIKEDINHRLDYAPHIGMILNLLSESKITDAEILLEEIDPETQLESFISSHGRGYAAFATEKYIVTAFGLLQEKSKSKKVQAMVRGLRGLMQYSEVFEYGTKKSVQNKAIKDFEYANEMFPDNAEFCRHLFWIYSEDSRDQTKAWKYLLQYVLNSDEGDLYEHGFLGSVDDKIFEYILTDFKTTIQNTYKLEKIATTLLPHIIRRLHRCKKYDVIVSIASTFHDTYLKSCSALFEVAFACSQVGGAAKAQKYYEMDIARVGETSATLNNLGVIYEKRDELIRAREYFQKASNLDSNEKLFKDNFKRVEKLLRERDKSDLELLEAIEQYKEESPYVQKKILDFYGHRNSDGFVVCPYRQVPHFLKMMAPKALDFFHDLLTKKYYIKVLSPEYVSTSNVYKLNPYLEKEIIKIEETLKAEDDLLEMCNRLNSESLKVIGYDAALLSNLNKVASDELRMMLLRDLKEIAIAIILKQYKSALVLSGSLIEAILMDRLMAGGIKKYHVKGSAKDIAEMDLFELLDVAELHP